MARTVFFGKYEISERFGKAVDTEIFRSLLPGCRNKRISVFKLQELNERKENQGDIYQSIQYISFHINVNFNLN